MSKKHFDEYYKTVCNQYSEMLEALHEVEELTMQQMIGPDRLDNIKRQIEPLKNNYMTLSYVAFLLNKPNRDKKKNGMLNRIRKSYQNLILKDRLPVLLQKTRELLMTYIKSKQHGWINEGPTIFVLLGNNFI